MSLIMKICCFIAFLQHAKRYPYLFLLWGSAVIPLIGDAQIGAWIGTRLNRTDSPVKFRRQDVINLLE